MFLQVIVPENMANEEISNQPYHPLMEYTFPIKQHIFLSAHCRLISLYSIDSPEGTQGNSR